MMKIDAFGITSTLAFVLAACGDAPSSARPKDPFVTVTATVETEPMPDAEDAADDPAIWVDAANPGNSVIIGTNKQRGLAVYGLDGKRLSFRDDGRMNNVDIRQNVMLGTVTMDIVAATNRTNQTVALYTVDASTRSLTPLASIATGFADPYGLCLYHSKTGDLFVIANDSDSGNYAQWRLSATEGVVQSELVRKFSAGSQAEGCAADDAQGTLFVAEEDVGLWVYSAEPDSGDARTSVDSVANGHLTADAEGVAIVDEGNGAGYIIQSSQGSNSYNVYDRAAPYAFRGTFVVGDGANIDGVAETDGLDVTAANLGSAFPGGVFIAQDGFNIDGADKRKANQNFKLVPWPTIRDALNLPAPQEAAP
jgi:3-phytase